MKLPLLLTVSLSFTHGWISPERKLSLLASSSRFQAVKNGIGGDTTSSSPAVESSENPCWQDMYDSDDDCLSNIASASFVAGEWLKSMPCAAGIEDCDMPTDLQTPETRPEGGVDNVDVMEFLGISRPESLKVHHDEDTAEAS